MLFKCARVDLRDWASLVADCAANHLRLRVRGMRLTGHAFPANPLIPFIRAISYRLGGLVLQVLYCLPTIPLIFSLDGSTLRPPDMLCCLQTGFVAPFNGHWLSVHVSERGSNKPHQARCQAYVYHNGNELQTSRSIMETLNSFQTVLSPQHTQPSISQIQHDRLTCNFTY